jgi:Glycosyl transferase family group 2
LIVVSFLIWGPLLVPVAFCGAIIAFHAYWMYRAQMNGIHAIKGFRLLRRHKSTDWRELYDRHRVEQKPCLKWADIRHIVVITNYTESADKLRLCLNSIARSDGAHQVIAVLAMEEREGEAGREKADLLVSEYQGRMGDIFATFHPWGLPGEVAGKSSNENWAARVAKRRLVDESGHDIDNLTITSCDVDTVFSEKYFACLTYKFATDPNRYRRFWQAPIFFYNNIWDVPASLRMAHCLSGLNHIARLSRGFFRMVFPQSTYSLSLRMAHEADYWDPDIIPEDWHMFLKCYYRFGGKVEVESMWTRLYMDGVRSKSYVGTFFNYYQQSKRHAWGCTDIPYSIQQSLQHPEIPLHKRLQRVWAVSESHLLWSSQWFLITTSKMIPLFMASQFGADIPEWFTGVSRWIMLPCMATLILLLTLDAIMRPKRPRAFRLWHFPFQYGQYFVMAFITFFTSALPALDAQFRLALGKRLEYRVTEKA